MAPSDRAVEKENESNPDGSIPMTSAQKFFFDLRGWILLPSVLSQPEVEEMKAEVYSGAKKALRVPFKGWWIIQQLWAFCRKYSPKTPL